MMAPAIRPDDTKTRLRDIIAATLIQNGIQGWADNIDVAALADGPRESAERDLPEWRYVKGWNGRYAPHRPTWHAGARQISKEACRAALATPRPANRRPRSERRATTWR